MKTPTATVQERTRRTASLQVPKQSGEEALRLLVQMKLLDRKARIRPEGTSLFLPLLRRPSSDEATSFRRQIGSAIFGDHEFEEKTRPVLSLEEALESQLPPSLIASLPASFDIVGDIAVVEFAPELSGHEKAIAEGILRVHRNVKSVLAKAGAVSGPERIRPLRHLAGESRAVTIHKESGCRFKVDLTKAYFSPRLSTEHQRVARLVQPRECVVDMFAGVGPFSILIAKRLRDVEVHAVDSNQEAARLLEENVKLNMPTGTIRVWTGDARRVIEENLRKKASRVIMNHPSAAREFVDAACMAMQANGGWLHYYTFAEGLDYATKAEQELGDALSSCGWKMNQKISTRAVRGVAPMTWQVAIDATVAPA